MPPSSRYNIPFNKAAVTGDEKKYIQDVLQEGQTSGNGEYTQRCHKFFKERYGFRHTLLTTSGTDALEMAALLIDLAPGDEVIMPSYTFVSTANAFALRGAKIVFSDSMPDHPNVDLDDIADRISPRTKAIVLVHYAGVACDIEKARELCDQHVLWLIEDAAHAIDSTHGNQYLGGIGDIGCLSFHETKNISCGEGGLLIVNNEKLIEKANIIWQKGTDRSRFEAGLVQKYQWVGLGSSFLPSELTAAYLWGQLQHLDSIQARRLAQCKRYHDRLSGTESPFFTTPTSASPNGHLVFVLC